MIVIRDKKVGKIGEKIAEKSFFGGHRKEKRMEYSSVRKIGRKSALSAIFRRKIEHCRKIGGKIVSGRHALGGALTAGEVADFSPIISIYRRFIGDLSAVLSAESRQLRFDPCF